MKQNTLPWMVVCLGWLLAFPVLALDINETLPNVRILAVYPGNIVVLSRGLEDDVSVGTHAKLRASEGYAARALCVKSGLLTSHWRIYRVVEGQLISKDLTYSLIGMDASEAPRNVENWQRIDHEKTVPAFDESYLQAPEKAPAEMVKSDLPESLEGEDKIVKQSATSQIIERNFDVKKLKNDFENISGSVQISPWNQLQGGDTRGQSLGYGISLGNQGKKYVSRAIFSRSQFSIKDGETGVKSRYETTDARAFFIVRNFSGTTEAFSDVTFRQARYGRVATPQKQYLISPVGLNWRLPNGSDLVTKNTISYAPTYDTRTHELIEEDGDITTKDKMTIRHSFHWQLNVDFTKQFGIGFNLDWRPAQDLTTWALDASDNMALASAQAICNLSESFSMEYNYQWLDDAQLHRINQMKRVVKTSSLSLRYQF